MVVFTGCGMRAAWAVAVCLMLSGPGAAAAPGCPLAATQVVDHLYRWYLKVGDRYREQLPDQQRLFEPGLYADLQAAFALEPSPAGFLDFDPFNGAQVDSYGFRLLRCRAVTADRLEARVLVKAGLRPSGATEQPIQLWLQRAGTGWQISDLAYAPDSPNAFRLQPLLNTLLRDVLNLQGQ